MMKRVRPKPTDASSNYPIPPVQINPRPVNPPVVNPRPQSSLPKTLTGNFGQSCPYHGQPTNFYCYKDRKFICEMCKSDTSEFLTKGLMRKWSMNKKIIDKKKILKVKLNEARKKLDEQFNSIKLELEQSFNQAKNQLTSFPAKGPYASFNENTDTSALHSDMNGLQPEQYEDIFNLQYSSEFQEESKSIDDEYKVNEEILEKYIIKLDDRTSSERVEALNSVKNLFNLN
jgi:hypothetical protein